MKNKKIFISGGAGVIGLELVQMLVECGAIVMVGDLKPRPSCFSNKVLYIQGDLNLIDDINLLSFNPEIFIHLAATFERTEETKSFYHENFHNNIQLSHKLMSILKDSKSLKKIIFASSYLIYDSKLYQSQSSIIPPVALNENDRISPRNLTGMAKLAHECELQFFAKHYSRKLSISIVRIFRGYGLNSRDVISRWIRKLINNEPIDVYGIDSSFDYIFSKDTANGIQKLLLVNHNGIVNLGTGVSRKVEDVLNILKKYFPNASLNKIKNKSYLIESSVADIKLLKKITNWSPSFTLEKAIPLMINFERRMKTTKNQANQSFNILITSGASKIPLIKNALIAARRINADNKVYVGDINHKCKSKYFADHFWKMPFLSDENCQNILNYCSKNNIKVIFPTRDGELLFWAKQKKYFANHNISVIVSNPKTIDLCLDKLKFYKFLLKMGFPVIESSLNIDYIKSEKFVIKERFGSGSNNIAIDISYEEAKKFMQKLRCPIAQPFIKGKEYSFDAWIDPIDNKIKGYSLRSRDSVMYGESDITTTLSDTRIEKQLVSIINKFRFVGPIVMQLIVDKHNKIHIIEINPRFGGASTSSIKIGLDSLYWSFYFGFFNSTKELFFSRKPYNLTQIRFKEDAYIADISF